MTLNGVSFILMVTTVGAFNFQFRFLGTSRWWMWYALRFIVYACTIYTLANYHDLSSATFVALLSGMWLFNSLFSLLYIFIDWTIELRKGDKFIHRDLLLVVAAPFVSMYWLQPNADVFHEVIASFWFVACAVLLIIGVLVAWAYVQKVAEGVHMSRQDLRTACYSKKGWFFVVGVIAMLIGIVVMLKNPSNWVALASTLGGFILLSGFLDFLANGPRLKDGSKHEEPGQPAASKDNLRGAEAYKHHPWET